MLRSILHIVQDNLLITSQVCLIMDVLLWLLLLFMSIFSFTLLFRLIGWGWVYIISRFLLVRLAPFYKIALNFLLSCNLQLKKRAIPIIPKEILRFFVLVALYILTLCRMGLLTIILLNRFSKSMLPVGGGYFSNTVNESADDRGLFDTRMILAALPDTSSEDVLEASDSAQPGIEAVAYGEDFSDYSHFLSLVGPKLQHISSGIIDLISSTPGGRASLGLYLTVLLLRLPFLVDPSCGSWCVFSNNFGMQIWCPRSLFETSILWAKSEVFPNPHYRFHMVSPDCGVFLLDQFFQVTSDDRKACFFVYTTCAEFSWVLLLPLIRYTDNSLFPSYNSCIFDLLENGCFRLQQEFPICMP